MINKYWDFLENKLSFIKNIRKPFQPEYLYCIKIQEHELWINAGSARYNVHMLADTTEQ